MCQKSNFQSPQNLLCWQVGHSTVIIILLLLLILIILIIITYIYKAVFLSRAHSALQIYTSTMHKQQSHVTFARTHARAHTCTQTATQNQTSNNFSNTKWAHITVHSWNLQHRCSLQTMWTVHSSNTKCRFEQRRREEKLSHMKIKIITTCTNKTIVKGSAFKYL